MNSILLTSVIFGLTYAGLALGRIPFLRTDRAGIAVAGAAVMLACGVLDIRLAAASIDFSTIALLFGMMVVTAHLRMSGMFALATRGLGARLSSPYSLLALTIGVSGVLSAFLVNDVVCVALTPLVIDLCRQRRCNALPYLVGLATASNIGSVATITGNPQNIIIGMLSQIEYLRFSARLAPIALAGLVLNFVVVALVYRRDLRAVLPVSPPAASRPLRVHPGLIAKSAAVTLGTVALFFAGQPIAVVGLAAAAILLLGRIRPEKVYRAVDWPLLVMFAGLFIVVRGFELHVVRTWELERWRTLLESPVVMVSALSVVLSNLVSNVPAVLLFRPLMAVMPDQEQAWLALSMSSTLAGNLTILGSVANLIVVESARRMGTELGFFEYLKVGIPLTVITTLCGVAWLTLVRY